MKILVVGGGTAGLISALILKQHLAIQVDVVKSSNIGIVGVGEGSTEHFSEFMKFIGISDKEIIKECGATYKAGIFFKDWISNSNYLHNVAPPFNNKFAQYSHVYAKQVSERSKFLHSPLILKNEIDLYFLNNQEAPFYQYHFDTFKLNNFLIKKCLERNISILEDDIVDINLNYAGEIDYLSGERNEYHYDFYIDATGFKKLLISNLGAKWNSYSEMLKLNSAITFQTEEQRNYNLFTSSQRMNYGWMFNIPVQGRCGNGYIYDQDYISEEEAIKEVEEKINIKINIGKTFKFDPGAVDRAWIKNCVAVGLSSVFFEPLEASSIGTTIQQSFLLMNRIINYSQKTIDLYNKSFTDIVENTRDFIFLHYMNNDRKTSFWNDVNSIKPSPFLEYMIPEWRRRMPLKEDFSNFSEYVLFHQDNFIMVLAGLGIFNSELIAKELQLKQGYILNDAENIIEFQKKYYNNVKSIRHRDYIEIVKNFL
jgi:tryptophan halogenase